MSLLMEDWARAPVEKQIKAMAIARRVMESPWDVYYMSAQDYYQIQEAEKPWR
ncbi:MAG: hypothetical protein KKG92_00940 [Gammaproteobacteria bacterium]|nr:hypothetical protein [Gammaproteobacteria bacterium]